MSIRVLSSAAKSYWVAIVFAITFIAIASLLPPVVRGEGSAADMQCMGDPCPCGKGPAGKCDKQGNGKIGCPCVDNTNGHTTMGKCSAVGICKGETGDGKGLGMDQLMQALKSLMDMMKPKDGGGSPPPSNQPPPNSANQGCTNYYQTSSSTEADKDPCAYFQGGVSGDINVGGSADDIKDAFSNISDMLWGEAGVEAATSSGKSAKGPAAPIIDLRGLSGTSGLQGDILVTDLGVTIFAGSRDVGSNIEVSGFYGSGNTFGQSQGLIARLCETRPWATNFLSAIISPSFFDNLCTWRGYHVGPLSAGTGSGGLRATYAPVLDQGKNIPRRSGSSTSAIQATAEIWAVPAAVPLGARTSIFWNARGVDTCEVTSDDGNFYEKSVSGGASTVPLTGATIFTVTCKGLDGSTVTDSVRVSIAI